MLHNDAKAVSACEAFPWSAALPYDSQSLRRQPHLFPSTQTIDYKKDLIPGEVQQAKFQVIELTHRSASQCFQDPVSNCLLLWGHDKLLSLGIQVSQTYPLT